jgi:hypothetical protein
VRYAIQITQLLDTYTLHTDYPYTTFTLHTHYIHTKARPREANMKVAMKPSSEDGIKKASKGRT